MGLGKTLQTLAVLLDRSETGPALGIAPTSVGFNWVHEAEKFAPRLKAQLYRETDRADFLQQVGPGSLVVCSYGLALRDAQALGEIEWKDRSSKLQQLCDTLHELRDEGHRVLVFSQFVKHLSLIREMLGQESISYEYLDGSTPAKSRQERVDSFQNGDASVFLISQGTIEEEILRLHDTKRDLVAGIMEGAAAAGKLSTEDLVALLRSSN